MSPKIVGSILYYTQVVNMTVLMALSTIAVEQTKAAERTLEKCRQLLDYLAKHTDANIHFHASDMIMNILYKDTHPTSPPPNTLLCHFLHFSLLARQQENQSYFTAVIPLPPPLQKHQRQHT